MATKKIDAIDVLLELSFDNGTTWKKMVCLTNAGFDSQRTTEKIESQCGVFTGQSTASWGFDYDAMVVTDQSPTEVSYKEILAAHKNKTGALIRQNSPVDGATVAGANFSISGAVVFPSIRNATPMQGGKVMTFSGRLEGDGDYTIAS